MPRALLLALLVALVHAGCGSQNDPARFPPPARPAASPPLTERPAGRVVRVGGSATAVAVDARRATILVATARPEEVVELDLETLDVRRRTPTPGAARRVGGRPGVVRLDDGREAVVDGRARTLTLRDPATGRRLAGVPAGIGPTQVEVADDGRLYVADTAGGSVLLFRTVPELGLLRRIAVPGSPYGTAIDRRRGKLWVTVTAENRVVQLTADGQPRPQRDFPTIRRPDAVAVHEPSGRVVVTSSRDGTVQVLQGYPAER